MSHQHNRINEKLQEYWQALRGGRLYPQESDINPEAIRDIWDHCFLVSINEEDLKQGYKYTYLGTGLIEAFGDDLTSRDISARLIETSSQPLIASFEQVIRTGRPFSEESQFTNSPGMVIKYRSCILPLGDNPEKVDYILGAMKWRAF